MSVSELEVLYYPEDDIEVVLESVIELEVTLIETDDIEVIINL